MCPRRYAIYNVTAIFDNAGNVVERYIYDPYGTPSYLTGAWASRSASLYAWLHLHQGGRWELQSGVYHFRHRDLSPSLGRWLTLDPIRFEAGDVNLYRCVGNGPTNQLDPDGLIEITIKNEKYYIHKSDKDPFPSKPHAHIGSRGSPFKVHMETGEIYYRGKPTKKFIHRKVLERLREVARGKGMLGVAIVAILVAPDVVQACEEDGVRGVGKVAVGVAVDIVVDTMVCTGVGVGVTSAVTVTVGGAAVTGLAGATGVGAAVMVTGAVGYEAGKAIGQLEVGGQSIHDHIADGIIWCLDKLGLWYSNR